MKLTLASKEFLKEIEVRKYSPKTIRSYRNNLNLFLCYCAENAVEDTRGKFVWCKEEKPIIRTFQPKDVKRMLSHCSGRDFLSIRDKAILTTFFETGIRCWELCCIRNADIHEDFIVIHGKNHKQRVVPITAVLQRTLIK